MDKQLNSTNLNTMEKLLNSKKANGMEKLLNSTKTNNLGNLLNSTKARIDLHTNMTLSKQVNLFRADSLLTEILLIDGQMLHKSWLHWARNDTTTAALLGMRCAYLR